MEIGIGDLLKPQLAFVRRWLNGATFNVVGQRWLAGGGWPEKGGRPEDTNGRPVNDPVS